MVGAYSNKYACPKGFDCSFYNSCPALTLPCPDGYFCSSYAGYDNEGDIDFRYAELMWLYNDVDITEENKELYTDPQKAIQSRCVLGFFCQSSNEMTACPAGHWCAESTVEPYKCDELSSCPSLGGYALDYTNLVFAIIFTILTFSTSLLLRRQQRKANVSSRKLVDSIKFDESGRSSTGDKIPKAVDCSIAVDFSNVTVSFPSADGVFQDIICNISGHIPQCKSTLMLGSTGCGKTTWLKALHSGGSSSSDGEISFWMHNGSDLVAEEGAETVLSELLAAKDNRIRRIARSELSHYVGYVPQEDILDRELTVRELLTLNARARAYLYSNADEIDRVVAKTLSDLDITHIGDSIIGGGENLAANISGGQLKRVNIACELVALRSPAVLLLDEPTAGLDASVAYDLMRTLQAMTVNGITVVSVLQQPRPEIYEMMDHLFLMGGDGSIVYEGPPKKAASHLQSLGHIAVHDDTSDADFCIDALNEMKEQQSCAAYGQQHQHKTSLEQRPSLKEQQPLTRWNQLISSCNRHSLLRFVALSYLNTKRILLVRLRNLPQLSINMTIHIIMACALSSGFSVIITGSYLPVLSPSVESQLRPYYPSALQQYANGNVTDLAFNQLLFFMSGALGSAASLAAAPVFAGKRSQASREHASGMSVLAFALGRIVGDVYFVLFNGFVFAGIWCIFGMPGSYNQWLSVILATSFAASGIGYLVSVLTSQNSANVIAVVSTFICCVFSGSEPALSQIEEYPVICWPWYLSFGTWTAEATYVTWSGYLSDQGQVPDTVQSGADKYGYDASNGLARSIGALLTIGIALRFFTVVALYAKRKS